MVLPALERGEYKVRRSVKIGKRPGGSNHIIDVLAEKDGRQILISVKWQEVSGTAEQKIPFEVICLMEAVQPAGGKGQRKYARAYLVLGGPGWTLRRFYVSGGLQPYIAHGGLVAIVTLEQFVKMANRGSL
jgi:hypothetical protein